MPCCRGSRAIKEAAAPSAAGEGVRLTRRKLARFAPVAFDRELVAAKTEALGHPVRRCCCARCSPAPADLPSEGTTQG
jgi:hypothetical protein